MYVTSGGFKSRGLECSLSRVELINKIAAGEHVLNSRSFIPAVRSTEGKY